jgi:hypothetical protein
MFRFLFGSGPWIFWHAFIWLGAAFNALMLFTLIRDAIPRPAGPASLGSVFIVTMVAGFLALVSFPSSLLGLRVLALAAGWGESGAWGIAVGGALLFCGSVATGVYLAGAQVAEHGGYTRSITCVVFCLGLLIANLVVLNAARPGRSVEPVTAAAPD